MRQNIILILKQYQQVKVFLFFLDRWYVNCRLKTEVISLLTLMNSYRRKPPGKIGMAKYLPPVCRILEYGAKDILSKDGVQRR